MSLDHENEIIEQIPTLDGQPTVFNQESAHRAFDSRLAALVAGATLSVAACGAGAEGAHTDTERPEPVITTVDVPVTTLDAPVVVTTEIPKSETTVATPEEVRAERQPGIIQPIDIEDLTADLTSEIDQEAFEAMLASASKTITWGYNNNSVPHLELATANSGALDYLNTTLDEVNYVKETQISHYQFGYRMEARGTYEIYPGGKVVAMIEEFENNRGALRGNEWESRGVYKMGFTKIETPVQMPDGTTELVPIWKFTGSVSD